ncbi:MAG: hypothetical protein CL512_04160 [Actinobacteria bacterium]|nr:hypothetical protein [Actinomycetota bacterium]|tara:strand:- start:489 stop:1052 length:564 start_codon:yes stop_codon:yes gene_type:complete
MSFSTGKEPFKITSEIDSKSLFISDFDETILKLDIDWNALREKLKVNKISDLWQNSNSEKSWLLIQEVELAAARTGKFLSHTVDLLESANSFAILTNNSESAVKAALSRSSRLNERCSIIVGRETLEGPKQDQERFAKGFSKCLESLSLNKKNSSIYYLGDQDYELEFARSLRAQPIRVQKSGFEFR